MAGIPEPLGKCLNDNITAVETKGLVYISEVVDINNDHRSGHATVMTQLQHGTQLVQEKRPVGEPGNGVTPGQLFQPLLGFFQVGDIVEDRHVVGHLAVLGPYGADRSQLRINLAIPSAVVDLPRPVIMYPQIVQDTGTVMALIHAHIKNVMITT